MMLLLCCWKDSALCCPALWSGCHQRLLCARPRLRLVSMHCAPPHHLFFPTVNHTVNWIFKGTSWHHDESSAGNGWAILTRPSWLGWLGWIISFSPVSWSLWGWRFSSSDVISVCVRNWMKQSFHNIFFIQSWYLNCRTCVMHIQHIYQRWTCLFTTELML